MTNFGLKIYFDWDGVRFTYQNQEIPILPADIFRGGRVTLRQVFDAEMGCFCRAGGLRKTT